jgi:coenzyme F420-reducing hydrogenase beta subunit
MLTAEGADSSIGLFVNPNGVHSVLVRGLKLGIS